MVISRWNEFRVKASIDLNVFCVHPTGGRDSFDTVRDYMDGGEEEVGVGSAYDVDENDEYEYDYLDDDENYFGGIEEEEEEEVKLNEKDDTTSKHTKNTNESFHTFLQFLYSLSKSRFWKDTVNHPIHKIGAFVNTFSTNFN